VYRERRLRGLPAPVLLMAGLLAGCQTTDKGPPPVAAVPPEPAVAQPQTDAAGPTMLALVGSDRRFMAEAMVTLAGEPVNRVLRWYNPETGNQGALRVLRDGFDADNRPCREFHVLIQQAKTLEHRTGFLCRGAGGAWTPEQVRLYPPESL